MRASLLLLLLTCSVWARPLSFSDGKFRIVFPNAFRSQANRVTAKASGSTYSVLKSPLKTLDPAQHLASLRRAQRAQGARVQLVRLDGLDGLEIRRPHLLARVFVYERTAYQAEVVFPGAEPREAQTFVRSLRFLNRSATPYTPQRMARYDAQVREVSVQKCAENLLAISSLLTGFQLKHKKYPTALSSLREPITRAYGYRTQGRHYLLFCSGHRHLGVPHHYPRSDDSLKTMLSPTIPYRPGY